MSGTSLMKRFADASGDAHAMRALVPELREQLRHAREQNLPEAAVREHYALPLFGALVETGDMDQARDVLNTELGADFAEHMSADNMPAGRSAIAWAWLGLFHRGVDDLAAAGAAFEAAAAAFRETGDEQGAVHVEGELGIVSWHRGELDRAQELVTSAYEMAERIHDARAAARWLSYLGRIAMERGDHDAAEHAFRTVIERAEASGTMPEFIDSMHALSAIAYDRGDRASAEAWLRKALQLAKDSGDEDRLWASHRALGLQLLMSGQLVAAESLLLEARELAQALELPEAVATVDRDLGMAAAMQQRWHDAATYLLDALAFYRRAGLAADVKFVTDHFRVMCSVTDAENCAHIMRLWCNAGLDPGDIA
jgi:tetratricopeptide (TPR) repeat protein